MALTTGSTARINTQTDPLSLRSEPRSSTPLYGPGSNEVGKLPKNSSVRIDGPAQGAFFPVSTGSGAVGYAAAAYLVEIAGPSPVPEPEIPLSFDFPADAPPVADPPLDLPSPSADDGGKKKMLIIGGAALGAVLVVAAIAKSKKTGAVPSRKLARAR